MKIKCEKIEHKTYTTKCYVDEYCCKKMKLALTAKSEHEYGFAHRMFQLNSCGIDVYLLMGDNYEFETKISYCPFCGKEIE